jgi:hypothetical protein
MKIGDLVRYCSDPNDGRLGIVISEVFDMRPNWEDPHLAVQVLTRHQHSGEEGTWTWQLEDIRIVSEA